MEAGFKNEENARMPVQNEMAVLWEEIKNIKIGSSCTVSSEESIRVGVGIVDFPWTATTGCKVERFLGPKEARVQGVEFGFLCGKIQGIPDFQVKNSPG